MTKAEQIATMAKKIGATKAEAEKFINEYLTVITETLKKEGNCTVNGLGTFEVVKRAKRIGRNPQTGKTLEIKAHKAVKFKAAKRVKDLINS